jgi:hypothetical protein
MVTTGTAEKNVGSALLEVGEVLGVSMGKWRISRRSVQRFMLERGVVADIQLAYEIIKSGRKLEKFKNIDFTSFVSTGITYSSDSTSHKHIEYECRTIALEVVDYRNPVAKPVWKLRTLGIGTSVNHSSKVQVSGLKARLAELGVLFNNSPLAKREDLQFAVDDFAYCNVPFLSRDVIPLSVATSRYNQHA